MQSVRTSSAVMMSNLRISDSKHISQRILLDELKKNVLNWKTRLQIIVDLAVHLEDIHSRNSVVQCISTDNVVLDENNKPTFKSQGKEAEFAWKAPELIKKNDVSIKSDIYAFGMLMLELCLDPLLFNKLFVLGDQKSLRKKKKNETWISLAIFSAHEQKCSDDMLELIEQCLQPVPKKRPRPFHISSCIQSFIYQIENPVKNNPVFAEVSARLKL
jgi:serine/threonine protein kinase